jgi:hypothetical protein
MENIQQKAAFLQSDYLAQLATIAPDTAPKWGKMNPQQMIEHMSDYVRIASGRTPVQLVTEEAIVPRMQVFLESEKPFKENTPNSLMADTPPPVRHANHAEALTELRGELEHFEHTFKANPGMKVMNPFFGELNYDQQVQLLHKHGTHHLRQFGIE